MDELGARRVAEYQRRVEINQRAVALIDDGTTRYYEAVGQEPMRDVTAERRADILQHIEALQSAIRAWQR